VVASSGEQLRKDFLGCLVLGTSASSKLIQRRLVGTGGKQPGEPVLGVAEVVEKGEVSQFCDRRLVTSLREQLN